MHARARAQPLNGSYYCVISAHAIWILADGSVPPRLYLWLLKVLNVRLVYTYINKPAMLRCRPMLSAKAGAGLKVLARAASCSALPQMPPCDFTPQPYSVSFGARCPSQSWNNIVIGIVT